MEEEQVQDQERLPRRAWLRVCDVAELLGVSRNTVRRWTDAGRLPAHRSPGGHRRYRRTDVEAMLDSLRIEAPDGVARTWKPRALGGGGEQSAGAERLTSLVDTGQELAELLATAPAEVPSRLAERLCRIAALPVCEITSFDDDGAHVLASVCNGACQTARLDSIPSEEPRRRLAATLPGDEVAVVLRGDDPDLDTDARALLDEHGCETLVFAPMYSGKRLTGTVELCTPERRGLEREAGLAAGFAQLAAHFLDTSVVVERLLRRERAARDLVELGGVAAKTGDVDELLREVARHLSSALEAACIDIYGLTNEELRCVASAGLTEEYPDFVGTRLDLRDNPLILAGLESGKPFLIVSPDDPRLSVGERAAFCAHAYATQFTVPLFAAGQPVGVLEIFDRVYHDFGDSLEFIVSSGQMIAGWIESSMLITDLERQKKLFAELVELGTLTTHIEGTTAQLRSVGAQLLETIDADTVEIYTLRNGRIHYEAGFDRDEKSDQWLGWSDDLANYPLTQATLESRDALIIASRDDPRLSEYERQRFELFAYQSEICLPLVVDDRAIGYIDVFDTKPRDFAEFAAFLRSAAPVIARTLENSLLLDDVRGRAEALRELVLIGELLTQTLDLTELVRLVALRLLVALDAAYCDIYRVDVASLTHLAAIGPEGFDDQIIGRVVTLDEYPTSKGAVETGEPLIVTSPEDPRLSEYERAMCARYDIRSYVSLPLQVGGRTIALIDIDDTRERDFGEHLDFVKNVGRLLAGAFEKAFLLERLEEGNRELRQLVDAGLEFGSSLDLDEVLLSVGDSVCSAADAACCEIYSIEGDLLLGLASVDIHEPDQEFPGTRYRLSELWLSSAALERLEPVSVVDISVDPLASDFERHEWGRFGFSSGVLLPLVTRGEVVGLSIVYGTQPRDFGELPVVRGLAQIAAQAIANASVYERLDESARRMALMTEASMEFSASLDLDDTLLRVARRLCAVVDVPDVDINVVQPDGRLYCLSSITDGEVDPTWTGQYVDLTDFAVDAEILESGVPVVVRSLDDPRLTPRGRAINKRFGEKSWLSLPLITKDRVIGIIDLIETRAERDFSDDEIAAALAVCQVAALAIDNAAVYDRLEETARRMTLMTEAGLEFSSSLDLEETLLAVGRRLCDAVGVPDCDINVLRGDRVECLMSVVDGEIDLSWTGMSSPLTEYSAAHEVIDERKVVKITSLDDPRVTEAGRETRLVYGEKSWMTVPLIVKDRVLGMVDLSETRFERDFSDDEIAAVQAICRAAALAIDNADLFADVQARTAETDMLNAIARKATATIGLHEMALDVADELRQVVPFARSSIAVLEKMELVFFRPHTEDVVRLDLNAYGEAALDFHKRLMRENVVRLRLLEEIGVWKGFPDLDGVCSAIVIALQADGRLIGALSLLSSRTDAFDEVDTTLLARVGTQVSLAIKNALLYRDIKGMHLNNLKALSAALNAKDYYTLGHAARVSAYMVLLGQKLAWPADLLAHVEEAAFLHDIGKISISDRVLLKPGKLNAEEWKSMKQHPVFSAEIIHTLFDEDLVLGVRHHHERWDGRGYPDGLEGIHVPLIARAMCVVDAYDAMSFRRPYRNALNADGCLAELQRCRGTQFDPEICDAFIEVLGELNERRKTAARIAAEAAARIDPAKHALLLSPEDEGRPEYAEIAGILREVRDANPPTHFLTTQARLDRRYVIVVDGEERESERSPLGADIFPDEVLQVLPQALAGEDPQVNALFADQFGVWVTGLAPIRDAHGETVAVVAADLPPFAGAESGGLRMASQDSLASILQTAAVHSSQTDIDTISDGLTGLYNHRYLHDRLREELGRAGEAKAPLSLLFCDIDHFARFNEELGHRAGDNALRSVAHVLEQSIRNVDLAARYGGEEFVVALLETDDRGAFEVAERIRERVHETWIAPSQDPLSISVGVVTFPGDGQSKEELLDKADWAMHVAKRQGRNRVVAFSPSDAVES